MSSKIQNLLPNLPPAASTEIVAVPDELLPRKVVSPEVTALGAEVLIDLGYFAGLMARHGMSDTDIAATTLKFVAHDAVTKEGTSISESDEVELGAYSKRTKTVKINVASIKTAVDFINSVEDNGFEGPMSQEEYDQLASEIASETTGHEIGHRIADVLGAVSTDELMAYYKDTVPTKLATPKLATRALYRVISLSPSRRHRRAARVLRSADALDAALNSKHWDDKNAPHEAYANRVQEEVERDSEAVGYPFIKLTFSKVTR